MNVHCRPAAYQASMRPPLNAGENAYITDAPVLGELASMRPPLNAGENKGNGFGYGMSGPASMRPPLNAGENSSSALSQMANSILLQ